jgi:hypothetical protein
MIDPIVELKVRAELLHRGVEASDPVALGRLRVLQEHRKADDQALQALAAGIQRKHCLAAVAREAGFSSWEHARRILEGDPAEADFGKLLYAAGAAASGAHLNHWFATYEEARVFHAETSHAKERRYLLAYQRHFFVVDRHFIETLGFDPEDADWNAIGWDWARPLDAASLDARRRLYGKLLTAARRPAEQATQTDGR